MRAVRATPAANCTVTARRAALRPEAFEDRRYKPTPPHFVPAYALRRRPSLGIRHHGSTFRLGAGVSTVAGATR